MESPTPLSETNLKRYKGIRTSKKRQHSCADFYLKESEDKTLGPRSVSLTALVSPDQKRPQSAIEPSRMSQLETLEAKMAKIEVSLSTLGLQQQQQQHHHHHQIPQRRKRNGVVTPTTRSLHSVSNLNGAASGPGRDPHPQIKELDTLKQSLKDKEHLIINLQAQLRKLSKRKLIHGSITSTDSGVVSLRVLSDSERKGAEERLSQLDKEMEVKRAEIKRINHRLERLDPSDNIDVRIQQAELEYELEREELNLMNMQEERRNLHTILDDNDAFQKRTENSLFASMPENNPVALYSFEVIYDGQNPSFTVGKREDRTGTYVTWTRDDLKTLKRGDRIVEINGTIIISKGVNRVEEFWLDEGSSGTNGDEILFSEMGTNPFRLVVMRTPPPPPPPRIPNRELHMLKEEVSIVSAKLEQVNAEKRELQNLIQNLKKEHALWEDVNERLRADVDKTTKERDNLRNDSVRLKHRISYLEEQVTELLHKKDSTNSTNQSQPVTVFQKGNQKIIVGDTPNTKTTKESIIQPSNCSSRPPSVTSNRNGESKALKTRLWETFRRATTSDSRSVCSVDSRRPTTENGYFKKRCNESSKKLNKTNPEPPQKPIRLSLQRATSTNNVYSTTGGVEPGIGDLPEMNPGLKRSNYSENTLLPDWAPAHDEVRTEMAEKMKKNGSSGSKHGIRWPSLRPASSMSYTMSNRVNQQQVKF